MIKRNTFLSVILSVIFSSSAAAQGFFENFDSVIAPALPTGWSSTAGTPAWTTTGSTFYSSPYSAFTPVHNNASDVRLTSPSISFAGSIAPVKAKLSFFHRFVITDMPPTPGSSYDGGVLEYSLNGGAFVDILAAGGSFIAGGYTHTITTSGNILNTRRVWAGTQAGFQETSVQLPETPPGSSFRLRFRLASDTIVGSEGWYVDYVKVTPDVDVALSIAPLSSEVIAGNAVIFSASLTNNSPVPLSDVGGFVLSGANPSDRFSFSSGSLGSFNEFAKSLQLIGELPPGSSKNFSFEVLARSPRVATGILKAIVPAENAGIAFLVTPTTFSPLTSPAGVEGKIAQAFDGVGNIQDLCETVSNPADVVGKIAIISAASGCSYTVKVLHAQAAGAVAAIVADSTFASPPIDETPDPSIVIPVVAISPLLANSIIPQVLAPFMTDTVFNLLVSKDVLAVQAIGATSSSASDEDIKNNVKLAQVSLVLDSDSDLTPDPRDGCPFDPAKLSPGQCGCGTADVDSNGNGIAQCRASADFKERVESLSSLVKKLNGKSTSAQTALKRKIRTLLREVKGITNASGPGISVSSSRVNLKKLGSAVSRDVSSVLDQYSSTRRDTARSSLSKLKAGIAV